MTNTGEARIREAEAHQERYKHGKAARTWDAVALEQPTRAAICRVSAEWMAAYEAADAAAEKAFRELVYEEGASRGDSSEPGVSMVEHGPQCVCTLCIIAARPHTSRGMAYTDAIKAS